MKFLLRLLLICSAALSAAGEPPPPMQHLTFFLLGDRVDGEFISPDVIFQFEAMDGVERVTLPPGGITGPFLRPISPELRLFREERIAHPPGVPPGTPEQILRHPLASVNIPVEWKNVFLLVRVDSRTGTVQGLSAMNQSAEVLPAGHLALISYLNRPVNVRLGEAGGELVPGGRMLLPVKRRPGPRGDMVLFLAGARNAEGEMEVLASRRISVNPDFRRLALLLPDSGGTLQIMVMPPAPDDPLPPESAANGDAP